MVTEGVEPSTVALLAQRSNQLSYATSTQNIHQFLNKYSFSNIFVQFYQFLLDLKQLIYPLTSIKGIQSSNKISNPYL